jgi:hypothetical protein
MRGGTNTYSGFSLAKSILDNGRNQTKGKIAMIITDGRQNEGSPAKTVTDALQSEGVQVFGIGVGSNVDPTEIQSWCSAPVAEHYFSVTAYDQLKKILQKIIRNACPHPPPPLTTPAWLMPVAGTARRSMLGTSPTFGRTNAGARPNAGKNCKFHLPGGLPTTVMAMAPASAAPASAAAAAAVAAETAAVMLAPTPAAAAAAVRVSSAPKWLLPGTTAAGSGSDPCNAFSSCVTPPP